MVLQVEKFDHPLDRLARLDLGLAPNLAGRSLQEAKPKAKADWKPKPMGPGGGGYDTGKAKGRGRGRKS
jgi:excinuclease ABC subunit B